MKNDQVANISAIKMATHIVSFKNTAQDQRSEGWKTEGYKETLTNLYFILMEEVLFKKGE